MGLEETVTGRRKPADMTTEAEITGHIILTPSSHHPPLEKGSPASLGSIRLGGKRILGIAGSGGERRRFNTKLEIRFRVQQRRQPDLGKPEPQVSRRGESRYSWRRP